MFGKKEQSKSETGKNKPSPDLSEFDPVDYPGADAGSPESASRPIPSFGRNPRSTSSGPAPQRQAQTRKAGQPAKPVKSTGNTSTQDSRWRLLAGLGIAVLTFLGALWWLQSSVQGVEVVVAAREIPAGQAITGDDLTTARLAASPDYAVNLLAGKEVTSLTRDGAEKRVAVRLLRAGEPVMRQDLVPASQYNRSGIPQGFVALSLPATSAYAVSRINRDDLVTLILTQKGEGGNQAALLAENIRVLEVTRSSGSLSLNSAVGSSGSGGSGTLSGLTLLVTLEQAQKISQGREQGVITVVLLPFAAAGTIANGTITIPSSNSVSSTGTTASSSNPLTTPATGAATQASGTAMPAGTTTTGGSR